ncbi:unnamed protein product [Owenia fusiformis]|uniref:Uncharacterized protein n=1 Tax=Owenia fusiformis TaxID=6347 RepID=A0A8J1TSU4_OWEFU|nr:unnamed protein product [Owenia fusiformis]
MDLQLPPFIMAVFLWASYVRGEIRCYCNDASCVRDHYMCKSQAGKCFSKLAYDSEATQSVHGCVEFLPEQDRNLCQGEEGDIIRTLGGAMEWPILMCCKDDMCNYIDNFDINIDINVQSPNDTLIDAKNKRRKINSTSRYDPRLVEHLPSDGDVWFKAAVIAVPISGGFILVLLVLLAIRMLKSDSRRQRHMQMRRLNGFTKAQLYVADHFSEKSYKVHQKHKDNKSSIYKDLSIKIESDFEKLYDKSLHDHSSGGSSGSCNSIIVWGKQQKNIGDISTV